MKTSNRSKFHKGGYAALLTTISLSITIMAFAMTAFRETRQSHVVQARNQVKLDYSQKEKAFLRSLLHIVPNYAMQAMMKDSWGSRGTLDWDSIFDQALTQARIDQSLDPAMNADLGISVTAVSSNTGDASFNSKKFVSSPNGNGRYALQDSNGSRNAPDGSPLNLPPRMRYIGGGGRRSGWNPIISLNKRLNNSSPLYTEMPYPEIAFGYAQQGSNFIAKRNWWAFTVNFGAETAAVTGIAPTPRTYVLSIYEVPTQLAISSAGATTSLGEFSGGTSWSPANIDIAGPIYSENAEIADTTSVGVVASRKGISLSSTAPTGQKIGGLTERRELQATTADSTFYRFSSASESGYVAFTPINRDIDFFDYFADTTFAERTTGYYAENDTSGNTSHRDYFTGHYDQNSVNETSWSTYSIGARQTQMQVEVARTRTGSQQPDRLFVTARFNGDSQSRRQRTSRGNGNSYWWKSAGQDGVAAGGNSWPRTPDGDDWFIQDGILPNGRPCLTLDLEKLPGFLNQITADDVTVNNSIWIGANYGYGTVDKPSHPSLDTDIALLITKSEDLSAYTNGLTIITPFRVYFADNFNDIPVTPAPSGATLDANGDWYPPVSVYAPEKRFGIQNTSGNIEVAGQIGYLPTNDASATVNPLDLKDGGTDTMTPSSIKAQLKGISKEEDLPPVSSMNWLTIIEEIH
ncbi:MAG: hypothetical protein ACSHYB_14470 [Roseibacillus sp.]